MFYYYRAMEDEQLEDLTLKMEVFQELTVKHLHDMRKDVEKWKKETEEKFKGQLEESMSSLSDRVFNLQSTSSLKMEDEDDPMHQPGPLKTSSPKVSELPIVPVTVNIEACEEDMRVKIHPYAEAKLSANAKPKSKVFKGAPASCFPLPKLPIVPVPVHIEDCEEDIRVKIKPFAEAKLPANAKLTYAQTAYFNYMWSKTEGKTNDRIVSAMITGGIKHKMWPNDWTPPDSKAKDLGAFLLEKIKNKRKANKRAKLKEEMGKLFVNVPEDE